jgi:hypothetical protein
MPVVAEHERAKHRGSGWSLVLAALLLPAGFVSLTAVHPLRWRWNGEDWCIGVIRLPPQRAGAYHLAPQAMDKQEQFAHRTVDDPVIWLEEWGLSFGFCGYGVRRGTSAWVLAWD